MSIVHDIFCRCARDHGHAELFICCRKYYSSPLALLVIAIQFCKISCFTVHRAPDSNDSNNQIDANKMMK